MLVSFPHNKMDFIMIMQKKLFRLLFLGYLLTIFGSAYTHNNDFLKTVLSPDSLVFDIGAYVGSKTERYLSYGARVIAVEPQKIISGILHKRFDQDNRVSIVSKGVAAREGKLNLYVCHYFKALSTFSIEWMEKSRYSRTFHAAWQYSTPVEVTTLDALIKEYGLPNLCKLDVENYEYEALCGLSKPIPNFIFEFHAETIHKTAECIARLATLGTYQFNFSFGRDSQLLEQWISASQLIDTIKKKAHFCSMESTYCGEIYARLIT